MTRDWKFVSVELPPSVQELIRAAGGADPKDGGMPRAMASLVGALPWIAVGLFEALPSADYAAFVTQTKANLEAAWTVIGAKNPREAFDALYERTKRAVN